MRCDIDGSDIRVIPASMGPHLRFKMETVLLLCALLTVVSACSAGDDGENPEALSLSSIPLSTQTPEPQIEKPEIASCTNSARFVEDLTIPDGFLAKPDEVLDKRWAVLNAGTCNWSAGYRLVRIDQGLIEAQRELALYPARSGEIGVWSVRLTAPDQPGDQMASWQAQAPDGSFFGDPVFVLIEVIGNP